MPRLESFDAAKLGERLRAARSTAGFTQQDAAAQVGVGRTTLVAIERGERRVRASELAKLAELYDCTVNSFLRPQALHVDVQGHFRAGKNAAGDTKQDALALLIRLASGYVELERAVGRPLELPLVIPEYPSRGGSLAHAEDAAMQVRAFLGLAMAPVTDMLQVAELQLGLRVFVRRLDSKVSGAYAYHPELGGCVLVNGSHPWTRRAWTLAHEIGHYVGEREQSEVLLLGHDSHDRFADAFAGAFLMPPAVLRRRYQHATAERGKFTPRDLILWAQEYHVSTEAMCRWLERLNLLPGQTYEALRERGLDAEVVRRVSGDAVADEVCPVPARLLMIAAEAYRRELVTESQLVEMLGLDRTTVRELVDGVPADVFDELG